MWESAERTTRAASGCDAVAIIAKVIAVLPAFPTALLMFQICLKAPELGFPQVRSKSEPLKIILEAQYRPSQDAVVVEVPAGLIDQEEDASQAAARELKEETGERVAHSRINLA